MIEIVRAIGMCTLQDLGAHGRMHEAVPPGGALIRETCTLANRRARNRDDALAIEICGRITLTSDRDLECATSERAFTLSSGSSITIESTQRRAEYLAVRGGLAGARTLLCAGGRVLRSGDRIDVGTEDVHERALFDFSLRDIRVIPGPDALDLDVFFSRPWRIHGSSNRIGTRLEGATIPNADIQARSRPMTIGAIEVTREGQPIVLGPEHPTTGGYAILGVIASDDLGPFFARPLGSEVRFSRT